MPLRDNARKVVLGTTSAVLAVIAAGLLAAAVAMVWLYIQRDSDGFLESRTVTLSTEGYAIASEELDFDGVPGDWLPANLIGTFRVEASSSDEVFIGAGPSTEVDEYLDGVPHTLVANIGPFTTVHYHDVQGFEAAEVPGAQDFWTTTASGESLQQIEWEAEPGEWTIVMMNADASEDVQVRASMAISNPWIPLATAVITVLALLTTAIAVITGMAAFRGPRNPDAPAPVERALSSQGST
ncbi:MAG TPA: hypothetical protein VFS66_05790 [Acidimicrobiia bacterium]|nr:hypothetical protein [Acidimicrobiia bacterium]